MWFTAETPSSSRCIVSPSRTKSAPKRTLLITMPPRTSLRQRSTTSGNTSSNSKTNSKWPRRPWRRPMGLHIPKLCRRARLRLGHLRCQKPLFPSTMKPALSAQPRITDSGKGKGKAHLSPEPYVDNVAMGAPAKFNVAAAYEWHALYDDNVVHANTGDILKVPTSEFGRTVHGILQGLHINSKGASGSALVEGRVPALRVMNLAEFQYATQALERAHSEKNKFAFDLLIAVLDIMGQAQRAKTRMALHKSIAKQWRLPSWAPIKVYNTTMGKAEYSAMTKGQDCNQKIACLDKQSTTTGDAHW